MELSHETPIQAQQPALSDTDAPQDAPSSEADELLMCPFCGGTPEQNGAAIRCRSCAYIMNPNWQTGGIKKRTPWGQRLATARADTQARWNRRALTEAGQ